MNNKALPLDVMLNDATYLFLLAIVSIGLSLGVLAPLALLCSGITMDSKYLYTS